MTVLTRLMKQLIGTRQYKRLVLLSTIIVFILAIITQNVTQQQSTGDVLSSVQEQTTEQSQNAQTYLVTKVRDGDTIEIDVNGKTEAVRLVGINTPESVDPRKSVQCYGKEASAKTEELLLQKFIRLEVDETQQDRDRYNRLLRFVFIDTQDIGLQLIKEGYARESLYSTTPHKYRQLYLEMQKEAQEQQKGLWNPNTCTKE